MKAMLAAGLLVLAPALGAATDRAHDQEASVQTLLESGAHDELLQKVAAERESGAESAESTYLAAQALIKMEQGDRAREEFGRLRHGDNATWKLIGSSGHALLDGNAAAAVDAARRATAADEGNPYAHYQLGLAAAKQNDFATASRAFARAVDLKVDFAYAHYYAGLAFQRQRNLSRAADHLEAFLKLAPEAPERAAVLGIMKTLRG